MTFWACAAVAFFAFVYIFKSVLTPFVLGLAIAYLLNPSVNALRSVKISRTPASLIILFMFVIVVAGLIALATPILYRQTLQLADDMPGYIDSLWGMAEPISRRIMAVLGINGEADVKALLKENSDTAVNVAKRILGGLASGGQAVFDIFFVLTVTPIVAFFVMKEWDRITDWVEGILPRNHKDTILDLLKQIDQKLSGFVRGQIIVAAVLGLGYAIALTIAGLKYGFLIGLTAGFLSIIPMLGSTLGLIISVAVAWFQSGELSYMAIIAAIFLVGQLIEGNILSPKVVGDSVGLHPLWVFFALLAGGALFGILGVLLAVPVAAVVGVLLSFGIKQYKSSSLYKGNPSRQTPKKKSQTKE